MASRPPSPVRHPADGPPTRRQMAYSRHCAAVCTAVCATALLRTRPGRRRLDVQAGAVEHDGGGGVAEGAGGDGDGALPLLLVHLLAGGHVPGGVPDHQPHLSDHVDEDEEGHQGEDHDRVEALPRRRELREENQEDQLGDDPHGGEAQHRKGAVLGREANQEEGLQVQDGDLGGHHHLEHPVEADLLAEVQEVRQEDGAHRPPAHLVPPLRPAQALLEERVEAGGGLLQRDQVVVVRDLVPVAHGADGAVDVLGQHARVHADELQNVSAPEAVAAAEYGVVVDELTGAVLDAVADLKLSGDDLVEGGLAVLGVDLGAALHDVGPALQVAPGALERVRQGDVVAVEQAHEGAADAGQHRVDVVALGGGAHHLVRRELRPDLLQRLDVLLHRQHLRGVVRQDHLQLALIVHGAELREGVHDDVRLIG
mmetsp:Transcript_32184/g.70226  ORF Transcript_32184/g.70226 Transcript_32184/m.70226 type:complete len:426 (-) Transcript_32184:699-1976(-)